LSFGQIFRHGDDIGVLVTSVLVTSVLVTSVLVTSVLVTRVLVTRVRVTSVIFCLKDDLVVLGRLGGDIANLSKRGSIITDFVFCSDFSS